VAFQFRSETEEMTTNSRIRYTGPITIRQSYMTEYLVECPRCKKEALVIVDNPYFQKHGKLTCANCMHTESTKDLVRYKLIVRRNCDRCAKEFEIEIPNQKEKVKEIKIPCPHCGTTRTYKPTNERSIVKYVDTGLPGDPLFNLPLWLQSEMKGNLFWAYNRKHLNDIKTYVASKLRERQTLTHTTMVEKLPTFIKDAKNREALIKIIERLERKTNA